MNIDTLLGDVSRDGNGTITGAGATTMLWFLERNETVREREREREKEREREIEF